MEILKIVIVLIGFILLAIGVVCIYDARKITQKRFSFGDRNEGAKILKIVGFIMSIVGSLVIIFQNSIIS